jgi:hypothetical protein
MRSLFLSSRPTAFHVVGYREERSGEITGPHLVRSVGSLTQARELCLACLWLESGQWCAVSVLDVRWIEIARFRRFPPGRKKPEVVELESGGVEYEVRRGMGARLAFSSSGRKRRSFGGKPNE